VVEDLTKTLSQIKVVLYGDAETETNTEAIGQLVTEVLQNNILYPLLSNLEVAEFEVCFLLSPLSVLLTCGYVDTRR